MAMRTPGLQLSLTVVLTSVNLEINLYRSPRMELLLNYFSANYLVINHLLYSISIAKLFNQIQAYIHMRMRYLYKIMYVLLF